MIHRIFGLLVMAACVFVPEAYAQTVTVPTFPSCVNPQGAQKASYSQGTHGIVGDSNTYTGSDAVYTLSESTLLQCFCPASGNGIQTNWWKISQLSQEDIDVLINQGWIWVPTGSVWGLDDAPYLAKNSSFSCQGSGGNNGNSSSSSSSNGQGGSSGQVAGGHSTSYGNILGLANTGNIMFVYTFLSLGILLVLFGTSLKMKGK